MRARRSAGDGGLGGCWALTLAELHRTTAASIALTGFIFMVFGRIRARPGTFWITFSHHCEGFMRYM
jgi:hypothetical protein